MEDWVTIKVIKKRKPGMGTRAIAELLNISRNTVKKALSSDNPPVYKRIEKVNPDIEPFKEYITGKLFSGGLIASRVLNEIKSKGYKGSQSAFYRFISSLNLKEKRTFCPYETSEAEQAQFDWAEYSVSIADELTKVYVFNYILGFSRYRVYNASLSVNQSCVFEAIENSINELGGTAKRLQTDNAKCFINNPSRDNFSWNQRYLAFCGHYGFEPSRSLPGHPWSKGKVENPFYYLEEHFIKGNKFSSFNDFLDKLKIFQHEVNNRLHRTIKQLPAELFFSKEKDLLLPCTNQRYVGIKEQVRKVTSDCLISFSGSRYSVPSVFALREVWLRVSKGYILEIYSSGNVLIAKHYLSLQKGKVIIDKSHYKNHVVEKGNFYRVSNMFLDMFPGYGWFIEKLKAQKRINHVYHLTQILNVAGYYPQEDLLKALRVCRDYNIFTHNFIKGYLEKYSLSNKEIIINTMNNLNINTPCQIKRPLSQYKLFNPNNVNNINNVKE